MDRLSVPEAAERLGVTQDAVRKRIHRDAITWDQDNDGRYYVYLEDTEDTTRNTYRTTRQDNSRDSSRDALITAMQDQIDTLKEEVADWKEEARRKDHLLAAALERIPAIEEAPPEPRESSISASPRRGTVHAPPEGQGQENLTNHPWWEPRSGDEKKSEEASPEAEQRSWWRRLFGA